LLDLFAGGEIPAVGPGQQTPRAARIEGAECGPEWFEAVDTLPFTGQAVYKMVYKTPVYRNPKKKALRNSLLRKALV
jgi:hypothetical protein